MNFLKAHWLYVAMALASVVMFGAGAVITGPSPSAEVQAAFQIDKEIARATVLIETPEGGGGSGVVVYQDDLVARVLTCYHVVRGSTEATVSYHNGMYHSNWNSQMKIVTFDVVKDLALLEGKSGFPGVARVLTERQYGQDICVYLPCLVMGYPATLGHPDGAGFVDAAHLTAGYISDLEAKMRSISTSAPITYGNSGGGCWVKISGHWTLVAIMKHVKLVDPHREHPITHVNYAVHPLDIISFLDR
jgi:S1-C subfamily serine protease